MNLFKYIKSEYLWRLLLIIWMGVIFYFSAQNGDSSKELSSGVLNKVILKIFSGNISSEMAGNIEFIIRKMAHFTEYFVLGILANLSLRKPETKKKRILLMTIIFCFLYAVSDEFHQNFSDGRSPSVRDVFIDSLGSLTGISLLNLERKRKKNDIREDEILCK